MFRTSVLALAVLFAASAGVRAETGSNTWSRTRTYGPEDFTPEAQAKSLREVADKAVRMLSGEERMQMFDLDNAGLLLETGAAAAAYWPEWKDQPRERIVRGLLGEERYLALEKACLAALESGDEDVRCAARRLLARGLHSRICEEAWAREVDEVTDGYKRTGVLGLSLDEYFSLALNLAHLGNGAGREVLLDILRANPTPTMLATRAIRAMQAAGEPIPDGILDRLLRSEDPVVADAAFVIAPKDWSSSLVMDAALAQLERLVEKYGREGRLGLGDGQLLMEAGFVLRQASREGKLPEDTRAAAKAVARRFVGSDNRDLAERTAGLFGELAGEEDEELLRALMDSEISTLRSRGLFGLWHCPADVVERHLDRIRELQDDPDPMVRLHAANCLQALANAGKIPQDSFHSPMSLAGFPEKAEKAVPNPEPAE